MNSLRSLVLRGGAYLSARQGLGVVVNFGGILLLTREIGPAGYGLYAAALGILNFLLLVCLWGVNVYLVRREGEDDDEDYHQAFTFLLLAGAAGTLLAVAGTPLLAGWVRLDGLAPVALAMFLSLPVALLAKVPLARLERALDYKPVAMIELAGLGMYYVAALPLAFGGFGAMAAVAGWWVNQATLFAAFHVAARYMPRLHWDRGLLRRMIGYGLGFSASVWVWQARELVNPLIVGRYLGAEAAGYVALAIRFARGLSFVKEALWRIAIAALARMRQDRGRLLRAVGEGMKLQLVAQAPLLVGFSIVGLWVLPTVSGEQWLPVMEIYPYIALGFLVNATFNLHASALYVLRKNYDVMMFHFAHIILFAGAALLLVPRMGLIGYGLAEVIALASYFVLHFYFVRELGKPSYRLTGIWGGAFALALFVPEFGWWAVSGLVAIAIWPRTWKELIGYARSMLKAREA